jgi:hypothetical protein
MPSTRKRTPSAEHLESDSDGGRHLALESATTTRESSEAPHESCAAYNCWKTLVKADHKSTRQAPQLRPQSHVPSAPKILEAIDAMWFGNSALATFIMLLILLGDEITVLRDSGRPLRSLQISKTSSLSHFRCPLCPGATDIKRTWSGRYTVWPVTRT